MSGSSAGALQRDQCLGPVIVSVRPVTITLFSGLPSDWWVVCLVTVDSHLYRAGEELCRVPYELAGSLAGELTELGIHSASGVPKRSRIGAMLNVRLDSDELLSQLDDLKSGNLVRVDAILLDPAIVITTPCTNPRESTR